jgi:transposase InsO family protein
VSTSAYYKWLANKTSSRKDRRQMLKIEIEKVFHWSKCIYGSPRITKELNQQGIPVSEVLVATIMRENHWKSISRKPYRATTDSSHNYPVAENILNRNFVMKRANQAWVSDITYIPTLEGWLYLTTVIDLFDRKVIGWSLGNGLKTNQTILPAFHMAIINRPIDENKPLIFHSDRGVQYACHEFTNTLNRYKNITQSMSRKGNCWDNAVAESFFKTIKAELIYHHKYQTIEKAKLSIFEYIETFYNTTRRHQQLNNLSITEFHNQYLLNLKNVA